LFTGKATEATFFTLIDAWRFAIGIITKGGFKFGKISKG
jgi:hypothetical protein